jgi:uncharacterized protein YcbK (DUF882 family)
MTKISLQVTTNFNLWYDKNLACPCCHLIPITLRFINHMALLQAMRGELGFPIIVNSGHRCEKQNKKVGGAGRSQHLIFATDIRPASGRKDELDKMHEWACRYFDGVGKYENFVHVDLRGIKARWNG